MAGSYPVLSVLPRWQEALRRAIRDPWELCRLLDLPEEWGHRAQQAAGAFGLVVPREFLSRMERGNPHDPLLRQILPLDAELASLPGFTSIPHGVGPHGFLPETPPGAPFAADPVGDRAATVRPGLLHKYSARALMVATGCCAVHCRYCFRRHYPYESAPHGLAEWEPALAELAARGEIDEIILSGGDPLTLVDGHLAQLAQRLARIPHLRRLRLHTRVPIVIPQRVTDELVDWLRGTRLTPLVVVHANHPAEIDAAVAEGLTRLVDAGIPVLNQAVLLRGVNDDEDCLAALCLRLVELRVMPYYLHQLDRVAGAAHFEVPEEQGRALIDALRRRLPGYAVPRYVRETPGAASKVPIA